MEPIVCPIICFLFFNQMFIFVFLSSEMLCIFGCVTLLFSLFSHTYSGQRFTLGRTKIKSIGLSFLGKLKAMACRFQEVELLLVGKDRHWDSNYNI